jgi:hypothetical protein
MKHFVGPDQRMMPDPERPRPCCGAQIVGMPRCHSAGSERISAFPSRALLLLDGQPRVEPKCQASTGAGQPRRVPSVLRWESQGLGVTLAFDEDGRPVGRVRRFRNTWEAHHDDGGLDRPRAVPMGSRADGGRRLGAWPSAGEAQRAVQRQHDRHGGT